jgi:hypothetical protein
MQMTSGRRKKDENFVDHLLTDVRSLDNISHSAFVAVS